MTTQTATLADFLLARIAEDEKVARSGADQTYPGVEPSRLHDQLRAAFGQPSPLIVTRARVLAECEAKRRIVGLHTVSVANEWVNPPDGPAYQEPERTCAICGWVPDACETVKALALPYADHPDFREEWRV